MGDRSNIVIEEGNERVYLYAHWGGERVLKSALHGLKSGRWNDPAYLARVVFEHMISDDLGHETGYGISVSIQDNEHPVLVISDRGVYFDGQTDPMPHAQFVRLVESYGDAVDGALDRNEFYDELIRVW